MGLNLLGAAGLSRSAIETLLASAARYESGEGRRHADAVVALAFFSDSVRTRIGFEVAAARLGARTTTVSATKHSAAMGCAESVDDALRCVADWCDAICVRHRDPHLVHRLAGITTAGVINCGNGRDEHPTQALVDLFAIQRQLGRVDGLRIAIVGNLLEMRAAHSLLLALGVFDDVTVRAIAPEGLGLDAERVAFASAAGITVESSTSLELSDVDVVYVAGLPKGRPNGPDLSDAEQAAFHITPAVLAGLRADTRVLCPLPRLDEIERAVDDAPAAGYFEQSRTALWMRMAILDLVLGASATRVATGGPAA